MGYAIGAAAAKQTESCMPGQDWPVLVSVQTLLAARGMYKTAKRPVYEAQREAKAWFRAQK